MHSKKKNIRFGFTKTKRSKVMNKSQFLCARCGRLLFQNSQKSTLDHIIPISRGGENKNENLLGLCQECNSLKGDRIVSPKSFYRYFSSNSALMKKADKMVKDWICKNFTRDYIINNPLLFDELYYSIKYNEETDTMSACQGISTGLIKRVHLWKLENHEVEKAVPFVAKHRRDSARVTLDLCTKHKPTYVGLNYNKKSQVESILTVDIEDNVMIIDIVFAIHYRGLGTMLNAIMEDSKRVLLHMGIDTINIIGLNDKATSMMLTYNEYSKLNDITIYKKLSTEE